MNIRLSRQSVRAIALGGIAVLIAYLGYGAYRRSVANRLIDSAVANDNVPREVSNGTFPEDLLLLEMYKRLNRFSNETRDRVGPLQRLGHRLLNWAQARRSDVGGGLVEITFPGDPWEVFQRRKWQPVINAMVDTVRNRKCFKCQAMALSHLTQIGLPAVGRVKGDLPALLSIGEVAGSAAAALGVLPIAERLEIRSKHGQHFGPLRAQLSAVRWVAPAEATLVLPPGVLGGQVFNDEAVVLEAELLIENHGDSEGTTNSDLDLICSSASAKHVVRLGKGGKDVGYIYGGRAIPARKTEMFLIKSGRLPQAKLQACPTLYLTGSETQWIWTVPTPAGAGPQ